MIAYWIQSEPRTITQVDYETLADLQRMVGGSIEFACQYPCGDVLYVDEEGLLKPAEGWFGTQPRSDQPFRGNGVVVGRETGAGIRTLPPALTLDELRAQVWFLDISQISPRWLRF